MKLYHFTGIKNVEAIKRDGLQSWCSDDSTSMVGLLRPVVFLCNTPTAEETDWERAIVRERCSHSQQALAGVGKQRPAGTIHGSPVIE
jgi:hypothetical protein